MENLRGEEKGAERRDEGRSLRSVIMSYDNVEKIKQEGLNRRAAKVVAGQTEVRGK